jgi:TetR/AcrR family transcriptional regulator, mexCD-oprJ operon repressor
MSVHSEPSDVTAPREPAEGKRRADAERNLSRIIEAATSLLAVNPQASMAEIAEASGLVRATLYRHFPTREDLLRAIYSAALEEALQAIVSVNPEQGSVTDAIRRVIDALLVVGDRYRIMSEERRNWPEMRAQEESVGAPLIALLERGQRNGELRADLPLRWLVAALFSSLLNEALRAVGRGDIERAEAGALVTTTFLDAVRTQRT